MTYFRQITNSHYFPGGELKSVRVIGGGMCGPAGFAFILLQALLSGQFAGVNENAVGTWLHGLGQVKLRDAHVLHGSGLTDTPASQQFRGYWNQLSWGQFTTQALQQRFASLLDMTSADDAAQFQLQVALSHGIRQVLSRFLKTSEGKTAFASAQQFLAGSQPDEFQVDDTHGSDEAAAEGVLRDDFMLQPEHLITLAMHYQIGLTLHLPDQNPFIYTPREGCVGAAIELHDGHYQPVVHQGDADLFDLARCHLPSSTARLGQHPSTSSSSLSAQSSQGHTPGYPSASSSHGRGQSSQANTSNGVALRTQSLHDYYQTLTRVSCAQQVIPSRTASSHDISGQVRLHVDVHVFVNTVLDRTAGVRHNYEAMIVAMLAFAESLCSSPATNAQQYQRFQLFKQQLQGTHGLPPAFTEETFRLAI